MFGLGKDKARAIREAIEANHTESLQPTIADRLSSEPSRPPRLFDDWLTEYEKIYVERGLAAASVRNTRMRLKRLRARFGTMDIRDIGTIDVAGYFSEMAKEGRHKWPEPCDPFCVMFSWSRWRPDGLTKTRWR